MNIEFNYDISDCDPAELGEDIFAGHRCANIGICINAIFTEANKHNCETIILQHISKEVKDALRKALGVKEKEETFYKVGDRFKHLSGIYRLTTIGQKMVALVNTEVFTTCTLPREASVWMGSDYSVKDCEHITQDEFDNITNGCSEEFKPQHEHD